MISQAESCRKDQKLIVLIDIFSVAEFPNDTRLLFELLVSIQSYKVVFAESSSFHLYTRLQPTSAKDWHTCLLVSKLITFKPLKKEESKNFMSIWVLLRMLISLWNTAMVFLVY